MPVHVKIAATAAEHDALFRLRHRVFVEQGRYLPPRPDGRFFDRYDAFPTTTNLLAIQNNEVIGGLRLAEPCAVGTPADDYFDYRAVLPHSESHVGSASMLCIERTLRGHQRVTRCLIGMFYCLAVQRGWTHVLAPCNPEIEAVMLDSGYRRAAPVFQHHSGVAVSPLVLELAQLEERMIRFVRIHSQEFPWHSLERAFFLSGELVQRAGEPGRAAYVVLDGVAHVEPNRRSLEGAHCLRTGDMFGELPLMTGRPVADTVVAGSELDLMVLDAHRFRDQLCVSPERTLTLFQNLCGRLMDAMAHAPDDVHEQIDGGWPFARALR